MKSAGLILAIGMRPCAGAILVLIFALAQGVFWAGVLSAFAMAAGTALVVVAVAMLTVLARNQAERLAGGGTGWGPALARTAQIAGGIALVLIGTALLMAPAIPFGGMPAT